MSSSVSRVQIWSGSEYWRSFCINWLKDLGIKDDEMRARDHSPEELCFYSKGTTDIEYLFPFGWGELWGIADRTDYDLTQHQNTSGESMEYFDDETKEKYIPYVIEPSLGADRVTLAFLCAAYDEEDIGTGRSQTSVQSFISIHSLHQSRLVCFHFPRSSTRVQRRCMRSFQSTITVSP